MRVCAWWIVLVLAACRSAPPPAPPPSDDQLAHGAASAFLDCFERDGAECRATDAPVREWAALATLALVEHGIPTEIVEELPHALAALREDSEVRRTFIADLRDHERWARGAGCEAKRVEAVGPRALALARAASRRIERLGLGGTDAGVTVERLAVAAQVVGAARLVQTSCASGQRTFWLALAPTAEGRAWRVVALYPQPPDWLHVGGAHEPEPAGPAHIDPPGPNLLDPWLPVYEEAL